MKITSCVLLNLFTPIIVQILEEQNSVARTLISVRCLLATSGPCYFTAPLSYSTAFAVKISGVFSVVHSLVVSGGWSDILNFPKPVLAGRVPKEGPVTFHQSQHSQVVWGQGVLPLRNHVLILNLRSIWLREGLMSKTYFLPLINSNMGLDGNLRETGIPLSGDLRLCLLLPVPTRACSLSNT